MPVADASDLEYYSCTRSIWEALGRSDVRLLKASWLISQARQPGAVLRRRQELPEEAFWQEVELIRAGAGRKLARTIIAVSYAWLTADHPDPDGRQLSTIARIASQVMLAHGDFAIFIDWCSLYQEPRSPEELSSYQRSLDHIITWYGHREVIKLLLTKLSDDCDAKPYGDRCWTTVERRVSLMLTPARMVLDLGRLDYRCQSYENTIELCESSPMAPMTPKALGKELEGKHIRQNTDRVFLQRKYHEFFMVWMGSVKKLEFRGLAWTDDDAAKLASAIRHCMKLREIDLMGNHIGDAGAVSLATALPRCRGLEVLVLTGNPFSASGEARVRESWRCAGKPSDGLQIGGLGEKAEANADDLFHYRGPFHKSQRHGQGTLHNPGTGFKYEGEFKSDTFHGDGEAVMGDGSKYTGQWNNGQKCGHGEYVSPDGLRYVGQWKRGVRDGRGKQEYETGAHYEGQWHRGLSDGTGVYCFPDGSRYEGHWTKGIYNGHGTLYSKDGINAERQNYSAGQLMSREVLATGRKSLLPVVLFNSKKGPQPVKQCREEMHHPTLFPELAPPRRRAAGASTTSRHDYVDYSDLSALPLKTKTALPNLAFAHEIGPDLV